MLSDNIKKNILDLQYTKYLQYFNTLVILIFTYIIGIILAFVTKQINPTDIFQLSALTFISIAFFSVITVLLLNFKWHQKNILNEIKKLNR